MRLFHLAEDMQDFTSWGGQTLVHKQVSWTNRSGGADYLAFHVPPAELQDDGPLVRCLIGRLLPKTVDRVDLVQRQLHPKGGPSHLLNYARTVFAGGSSRDRRA